MGTQIEIEDCFCDRHWTKHGGLRFVGKVGVILTWRGADLAGPFDDMPPAVAWRAAHISPTCRFGLKQRRRAA